LPFPRSWIPRPARERCAEAFRRASVSIVAHHWCQPSQL
jgi:hypothetical protein